VLLRDDWRRDALHANHRRLKEGLLGLGYVDDVARSERQILSVTTGDGPRTTAFRNFLAERGIFGSVFCPPATREGRAYLRFTVNSAVTDAQIDRFLETMEEARPILMGR
jgi:CAI-1 autoinducer synthase